MDFGDSMNAVHTPLRAVDQPRRSTGHGLRFLVGGTIGNGVTITPSVHAVFGTFLIPVTKEFGWSRAAFSTVLLIIALAAAVVYPIAGRLADRLGGRVVLTAGYGVFALSLSALAFLDGSLRMLYAYFALVGLFGAVPSTALLSKIVSERFEGQATALAITAGGGNAIGCMVMPVIAAAVLQAYGWRMAYLTIAVIVLVLGAVSVTLLGETFTNRQLPEPEGERQDIRPTLRSPTFWLLLLTIGLGAGGTTVIFSHLIPILAERGVGLEQATAAVSIFALVALGAQIMSGRLLDKSASPRTAIASYLAGAPGLALIGFGSSSAATIAGVLLLGAASGMQFAALPYLIGRYFGYRHFGLLVGLMYSAVVLAQGLLPVILDASFDVSGSYHSALLLGCAAYAIGAASLGLLPAYGKAQGTPHPISL